MRCDVHPDSDAVGTCAYCGRGVCDQCKVRVNEKVHCKVCVEAGRIRGAPVQQTPPPTGPPIGMAYAPHPGVDMTSMIFKPPLPKGTPKKIYFQFGTVACYASMVMSFLLSYLMFSALISPSYDGTKVNIWLVASLVLTFFLYPVFISLLGFYKNYGNSTALVAFIAGLSLLIFYQVLWGYYIYHFVSNNNYKFFIDTNYLLFLIQSILGGALLFVTFAIRSVSFNMVPRSPGREATTWALALMAGSTIAFLCTIGLFIFGWFLLGLALGFLGNLFRKAPMPEPVAIIPKLPTKGPSVPGQGPS
jgi:MFS family permease